MKKKNKIKKIFKNLFIFSLICVFSSCEFFTDSFNAPVKDFFMDNTEEAAIELFEFSSETYKNSITEKLTVSSLQDANVVLYLRNPQEYNFITSKNMTSTFGSFLQSEYYLVQDENDKTIINLTIPKELLAKAEIESRNNEYNKLQDISINLFHPVSKAEFLPFTLEFDCDTVPPKILSPVFYSTNSSYIDTSKQNNYVIAFNMPKKSEVCSLGVHNDLEKLLIDETEYEVSIADDGTITFPNNPEIVSGNIEEANGIEALKAKFFVQDDYQPFYFVTNKQISIEGAKATLSLVDKGNFYSKIDVSSNTRMLGKVLLKANDTVFTSETEVIEINQEVNESYANITIIPPSVSVDLDGTEEEVSDVFVKYTIKNLNTGEIFGSGVNNGKDSVQIKIPSGKYSIECVAQKDYYADSVTTFGQINIQNIQNTQNTQNTQTVYIYVSADGNDQTGNGSEEKPFATIQKAQSMFTDISNEKNTIYLLSDILLTEEINLDTNSVVKIEGNNHTISYESQNIVNNGKLLQKNVILGSSSSKITTSGTGKSNFENVVINGTIEVLENANVSFDSVKLQGNVTVNGNLFVKDVVSENSSKLENKEKGKITLAGAYNGTICLSKISDSENVGTSLICGANLAGSKIKIELEESLVPTLAKPIVIVENYSEFNDEVLPKEYFINDDFGIELAEGGNVILAIPGAGGSINVPKFEEVVFKAEIQGKIITITAENGGKDISDQISKWNIKVYSGFTDITTRFDINKNEISSQDAFPAGEVLQIFVNVTYNGLDYGQTLTLTL